MADGSRKRSAHVHLPAPGRLPPLERMGVIEVAAILLESSRADQVRALIAHIAHLFADFEPFERLG